MYKKNLLNGAPYDPLKTEIYAKNNELQNKVDKFWGSFNTSIQMNNRGLEGKQRILSIIVDNFGYHELQENLKVFFIIKIVLFIID